MEEDEGGGGCAGRHVGGSLFVNVPAEMTGRWTLRPRPELAVTNRFDTCNSQRLVHSRLLDAVKSFYPKRWRRNACRLTDLDMFFYMYEGGIYSVGVCMDHHTT